MKLESGKTFLMVTGASRGLGRAFAVALAKEMSMESGNVILLTSRGLEGLQETAKMIKEISEDIKIELRTVDHANDDHEDFFGHYQASDFQHAVVIHNAGDLADQGTLVKDFRQGEIMSACFKLNYVSPAVLNSKFMAKFVNVPKIVVNISSLAALLPFVSWGNYCASRAARDMLFKVLATEESGNELLKVLNYAPGPNDTAVIRDGVLGSSQTHPEIRKAFQSMYDNNTMVQPHQAAEKLVKILKEDKFKSGDHVDYYDD